MIINCVFVPIIFMTRTIRIIRTVRTVDKINNISTVIPNKIKETFVPLSFEVVVLVYCRIRKELRVSFIDDLL
jgi:hypothetical protein